MINPPRPGHTGSGEATDVRRTRRAGVQDAPDPQVGPGQAVVRPLAVSRCDLDIAMAAFGLFPGPFTVGHEIAAEVVDVRPRRRADPDWSAGCRALSGLVRHLRALLRAQLRRVPAQPGPRRGGVRLRRGGRWPWWWPGRSAAGTRRRPPASGGVASISDVALATIPTMVIDGYRAVVDGLRERPGSDVLIVGGDAPSISLYTILCAQAWAPDGSAMPTATHSDWPPLATWAPTCDRRGSVSFRAASTGAPIVVAASLQQGACTARSRSTEAYGRLTSVDDSLQPRKRRCRCSRCTRAESLSTPPGDSRRYLPELLDLVAAGRIDPLAVPPPRSAGSTRPSTGCNRH